MPRLILTRSESELVRNFLQDRLMTIGDDIAQAEDDGLPEMAKSLRRTRELVRETLDKVTGSRG